MGAFASFGNHSRGLTPRQGLARVCGHQARRRRLTSDIERWLAAGHTITTLPCPVQTSGRCYRWPVDNDQKLRELLDG